MRVLEISATRLQGVIDRALGVEPRECCGVLVGRRVGNGARVEKVIDADNVAAAQHRAYEIDPRVLAVAQRRARRDGREIVGYYHSHPDGPTRPSERDRVAAWPATSYLIVSTGEGVEFRPRSWSLGPTGELEEDDLLVTQAT